MNKGTLIRIFGVLLLCGALGPLNASRVTAMQRTTTATAAAERTRFLLHAGEAYYSFHHFVYLRYKNGQLAASAPHHLRTIAKAAVAVLFSYHELKLARNIANSSHSQLLHALVMPLNGLAEQVNSEYSRLHGGLYRPIDMLNLNNSYNRFNRISSTNGYGIVDHPVNVFGAM